MINILAAVVGGLVAAIVFSMFTGMARATGMTKMSIEKTMGAMFGEGPGATLAGWVMHFVAGIVFAIIYAYIFSVVGATNGWLMGGLIGLIHGIIIGAMVMPMMGAVQRSSREQSTLPASLP